MCGIVGLIRKDGFVHNNEILKMTNSIIHRGPDEGGVWVRENIGIGHRRLSIIDLTSGKQPMSNCDESIVLTYNGEIYNHHDLKMELKRKGHVFKTNSDTEVILKAYEEWGEKCLDHFRGMFAFAIVDLKKKLLFIARDYLGIKPLVYYYDGNMFAFASEMQAIKSIKNLDKSIDLQAINQYLWLQYIPAPRTIYSNIKKLRPGCYITIDFDLNISEQIQYYHFKFQVNANLTRSQAREQLDKILFDSVEKHMISDVSYGAFLSGGIDSSLVVDYMSKILTKPVKTFSIGFKEAGFNELEYAQYVSRLLGTEHYYRQLDANALKILPELVQHYGEPFGDSSAIPTYFVSQLASDYVKMALSGDGSDELFVGYESYFAWDKLIQYNGLFSTRCREIVKKVLNRILPSNMVKFPKSSNGLKQWLSMINYMNQDIRNELWKKDFVDVALQPLDCFERLFADPGDVNSVNKVQYMDMNTYLPYDILTKVDIASMCHSIEVRTPFVDKNVWEYALQIPATYNYCKTKENDYQGKMLLKDLMRDRYSNDFLYRRKQGFSLPLSIWFADENSYAYNLKQQLTSKDAKINQFFEVEKVKQIINSNNSGHIWVLVFLEEWLQQNL